MLKMIDNNIVREKCVFCLSEKIRLVGPLEYASRTEFSTHVIYLKRQPEMWSCRHCGSHFTQNAIPEPAAMELYRTGESGARWGRLSFSDFKPPEVVRALRALFQLGASVLDIGCNTGELLDFAKVCGCKTAGVEPSLHSQRICGENGHATYASIGAVNQSFDVVTAFDLVEHLYDLNSFFSSMRERLNPGGALVLLTGDVGSLSARLAGPRWWYARYPEHVVFPSRHYLKQVSGFRSVRFIPTYAASAYRSPLAYRLKRSAYLVYKGLYNGLPAVGPDHMLAVLKT